MKKTLLIIRNSKSRQQSAHGPRSKHKLNARASSNLSAQDLLDDQGCPNYTEISQKSLNSFFDSELVRFDKYLDSFEISQQNHSTSSLSLFSGILQHFYLSTKVRDNEISSRLIRVSLIFDKYFKLNHEIKQSQVVYLNKPKETRENFSQTLTGSAEEEIIYPDTSKEILFIKSLIEKFDKLKSGKIKTKLVDLHENLTRIDFELPSPSDSPEPYDLNISTQTQQLSTFIKVLRSEIKTVLSKNNIAIVKLNKGVQFNSESKSHEEAMKEKILETVNLRNQINHRDKEIELLKENLNKCRINLMNSERKIDSLNLELIQVTNRFRNSEDQLKSAKQRINYIMQVIAVKNEKKKNVKRLLRAKEKEFNKVLENLKKFKEQSYNLTVNLKVAEEKLEQIQESWIKSQGEGFQYKNVNTFEIASKYSLFKPVETECLSPEDIITIKNTDQNFNRGNTLKQDLKLQNISSNKESPRSNRPRKYSWDINENFQSKSPVSNNDSNHSSPEVSDDSSSDTNSLTQNLQIPRESLSNSKQDIQLSTDKKKNHSEKNTTHNTNKKSQQNSKVSSKNKRSSIVYSNPDSHKRRLSSIAVENFSNSLSTIIENSPMPSIPIDSFADLSKSYENKEMMNDSSKTPADSSPSKKIIRKGYEMLTVSLAKELKDSYLNRDSIESVPRTPLLQCLMNEKEMMYKVTKNTVKNEKVVKTETKSQAIQCTLIGDQISRKGSRSPVKNKRTILASHELDSSTLENLKKLGQESGMLKENDDIDSLPPAIQVEIIKCFEGHDSKRCETFCIHLKRALAIRGRDRGIPYPLKTILFNSQID